MPPCGIQVERGKGQGRLAGTVTGRGDREQQRPETGVTGIGVG
jgi:hypothetical protein